MLKARDAFAAMFGRSGMGRNLEDGVVLPAVSPRAKGSGAPSMRLAVLFAIAAVAALVLPVAASAAPATLTLNTPTHSIVTAHLSGKVEVPADGFETYWCLEYAEEGVGNWSGFCYQGPVQPGETATEATIQTDLTLKPETAYEVRLSALNFTEGVEEHTAVETFTTDPAVAPSLTLGPAEDVSSHGVHLSGTIDPEGGNEDTVAGLLPIPWELQVNKDGEGWNTIGSGELTGAKAKADDPVTVEATSNSLVPNSHYEFRLLVRYAGIEKTTSADEFDTPAAKPSIDRDTLWELTQTSIILRASLNPENAPITDCHFEWGANGALDHSTPCEGGPVAHLTGLTPGTKYSFRLVATNFAGTNEGVVRSFTTPTPAPAPSCSNEAIRIQQHFEHLPECRALEMVTPLDKGNGDVFHDGYSNFAATDGNAISFVSRSPFGDTLSSAGAGVTHYMARRGPDGWASHGITPLSQPEALQTFFGSTLPRSFSDDLSTLMLYGYNFPRGGEDTPPRINIYLEDTATGGLQKVTQSQADPPSSFDFLQSQSWGVSSDARHLSFVASQARYLPEAVKNKPNVYQWDEGVLSLAGILPDGTVPPEGSDIRSFYRDVMSDDGSRQLFTASQGGPDQLFQRIDGERTVWISEPEYGSISEEPVGVQVEGATPDGRTIFFSTESRLVEEDENGAQDVYRWTDSANPTVDPNNLTLISRGDFGGGEVVGFSDDGGIAYYQTLSDELIAWDHGVSRLISSSVPIKSNFTQRLGVLPKGPGFGRVTPDGRYLAFVLGSNNETDLMGHVTNTRFEMYLYRLGDDTLNCVSCPSGAASGDVEVWPAHSAGFGEFGVETFRPRFLSSDGQVFFTSPEALAPNDSNGLADVYQYDSSAGELSLLSSGRGGQESQFAEASSNGDDVFFVTRQPLALADSDDLVDIYDARVGGGRLEAVAPPTVPCTGEACQGAGNGGSPAADQPASHAAKRGNVARHRCVKRRHGKKHAAKKQKHAAKKRCAKKRKHHKRDAKSNRRAAK